MTFSLHRKNLLGQEIHCKKYFTESLTLERWTRLVWWRIFGQNATVVRGTSCKVCPLWKGGQVWFYEAFLGKNTTINWFSAKWRLAYSEKIYLGRKSIVRGTSCKVCPLWKGGQVWFYGAFLGKNTTINWFSAKWLLAYTEKICLGRKSIVRGTSRKVCPLWKGGQVWFYGAFLGKNASFNWFSAEWRLAYTEKIYLGRKSVVRGTFKARFVLSEKMGKIGLIAHFLTKKLLWFSAKWRLACTEKIYLCRKSIVRGNFPQGLSLKRLTILVYGAFLDKNASARSVVWLTLSICETTISFCLV